MVSRVTQAGNQTVGGAATASFANSVAGGWIGYVPRTSDQTGITAEVDLSGVTVTVTANAGRRLKITGYSSGILATNVDTVSQLSIYEGSTSLSYARTPTAFASLSYNGPVTAVAIVTPSTGSHTYKLRVGRVAGSGTITVACDVDRPAFILVEDIGPA